MASKRLMGGMVAAGIVAVGVAVALTMGRTDAGQGQQAQAEPATAALEFVAQEVIQPQLQALPVRITFSGPLVAPRQATLRARLPGTLTTLDAAEGERVRVGQVVGRIDDAEWRSRQVEREAIVASAQAALAQAEHTHASNVGLAAQRFISAVALEQSRTALEAARAQHQAAEAARRTVMLGSRDLTLVAPIDGIVAKRHVLPGEKLAPEQPVLSIVDIRQLELVGRVGTHEVARLQTGQPARLQVEGMPVPVSGRIARIAPAAEPGTRAIAVVVAVANPDERLRAGQYGMASVDVDDATPRLTLPAAAVVGAGGEAQVWTIEGGTLARRSVTLGRRDAAGGRVEVTAGLAPDAVVLAARFENLREGAAAKVVEADTARVASASSAAASAPSLKQ